MGIVLRNVVGHIDQDGLRLIHQASALQILSFDDIRVIFSVTLGAESPFSNVIVCAIDRPYPVKTTVSCFDASVVLIVGNEAASTFEAISYLRKIDDGRVGVFNTNLGDAIFFLNLLLERGVSVNHGIYCSILDHLRFGVRASIPFVLWWVIHEIMDMKTLRIAPNEWSADLADLRNDTDLLTDKLDGWMDGHKALKMLLHDQIRIITVSGIDHVSFTDDAWEQSTETFSFRDLLIFEVECSTRWGKSMYEQAMWLDDQRLQRFADTWLGARYLPESIVNKLVDGLSDRFRCPVTASAVGTAREIALGIMSRSSDMHIDDCLAYYSMEARSLRHRSLHLPSGRPCLVTPPCSSH